jgi:uncharacterized membrane protein (UPF0127 family)
MRIRIARHFWSRAIGLLAQSGLPDDRGLLILSCSSVHTCFMRFSIDVVFLDRQGTIVRIVENLKPWRFAAAKAQSCLELGAGNARRLGLQTGQSLSMLSLPITSSSIVLDGAIPNSSAMY